MLYNPVWEDQADRLSLVSLIAWLETRNPADVYSYINIWRCPLTQWLESQFNSVEFGPSDWEGESHCVYRVDGKIICLDPLEDIIRGDGVWDWTYGAALRRARKALDESSYRSRWAATSNPC